MPANETFTPQRHEIGSAESAIDSEAVREHEDALTDLEKDIHLEASTRRRMAARLVGIGRRQTPALAEHLAWLLEHETDALTAYGLYVAVLAVHPDSAQVFEWQRALLQATPFALLRTALMDDLWSTGAIEHDSAEGRFLADQLDRKSPEHRAALTEQRWLAGDTGRRKISEVTALLQPQASMAEKNAGVRIMRFASDPRIEAQALPALIELFRAERHRGLSRRIADTIARRGSAEMDLDLAAQLIRTFHGDAIPAAESVLSSMFYGVEAHLMDSIARGEPSQGALAQALLAQFSPNSLPADGEAAALALAALAAHGRDPRVAIAATAALQASGRAHTQGASLVYATAAGSDDPEIRALALRVLAEQPRALLPLFDELKALAVVPHTDPRIRNAAFLALANSQQSGLPIGIEAVIDLYFQYLGAIPLGQTVDPLYGLNFAEAPEPFLARFCESLPAMQSQSARLAALAVMENPFSFGIGETFEPYWPQCVAAMLQILDEPRNGDLHTRIFWNMLHDVAVPEPAAAMFTRGLKERLARVKYTKRSRSLIEDWLQQRNS